MDNNQGGRQATTAEHGIEVMKQMLLPSMSEDMKAMPKLLKKSAGEKSCCIYRVPQSLAGGNVEACWPRVISIGPYHHGEPQLQMLEEHKWRYLRATLDRIQTHGIGLEDLIDVVAPKEEMIRQCYSESTDKFSGPDLVKMMVLDGCFIIELLLRRVRSEPSDLDDSLLANSYVFASLKRDLLRLENQIPYFILEDLFETTNVTKGVTTSSLADLALDLFGRRHCNLKGEHLLDLFRLSFIPLGQQNMSSSYRFIQFASKLPYKIRSASNLRQAGIRFKPITSTFLEINYDCQSHTIGIGKLIIDDTLICILLNMVAFEKCRSHCDKYVITYAMFMGCLIQTEDDAQLLNDCGIIRYYGVNKEDVVSFFHDFCKDASCDILRSHLASSMHPPHDSHLWWEQMKYLYFGKPWALITFIISLVTLTGVIQTVYAVLQYYQPR